MYTDVGTQPSLKQYAAKNVAIDWSAANVRLSAYRPFNAQWGYLDRRVNDMIYQ
ncbi:MAG: type ISP restriction/modification enzyme, partial [Mycobacterium sp.]